MSTHLGFYYQEGDFGGDAVHSKLDLWIFPDGAAKVNFKQYASVRKTTELEPGEHEWNYKTLEEWEEKCSDTLTGLHRFAFITRFFLNRKDYDFDCRDDEACTAGGKLDAGYQPAYTLEERPVRDALQG